MVMCMRAPLHTVPVPYREDVRIVFDTAAHSAVIEAECDGEWSAQQIFTLRNGFEAIGLIFAIAFVKDTALDLSHFDSWTDGQVRRTPVAGWQWVFTRVGDACSVSVIRGTDEPLSYVAPTFLEALGWAMRLIEDSHQTGAEID